MDCKIIRSDGGIPDVLIYRTRDGDTNSIVIIHTIGKMDDVDDCIAEEQVHFDEELTARLFVRDFSIDSAIEWCDHQGVYSSVSRKKQKSVSVLIENIEASKRVDKESCLDIFQSCIEKNSVPPSAESVTKEVTEEKTKIQRRGGVRKDEDLTLSMKQADDLKER